MKKVSEKKKIVPCLGVTKYSLLFKYSRNFKLNFKLTLLLPLVRKLPFDVYQEFGICLVK